jgi:phosphate transport system substrate-binding protein
MRLYTKARIEVFGAGTVAALESLVNRHADVAAIWRQPTAEEREIARSTGDSLSVFPYAVDGLGIIVPAGNTVPSLSPAEVRALFTGKLIRWSEVGGPDLPVTVYAPAPESGLVEAVVLQILEGEAPAWVATPGHEMGISGVLSTDAGGVTVGGLDLANDPLRAVPIRLESGEAVVLHPAELLKRRYPWRTKHVFVVQGEARDLASGFISYVTSAQGQKVAVGLGYGPATAPSRLVTLGGKSGR